MTQPNKWIYIVSSCFIILKVSIHQVEVLKLVLSIDVSHLEFSSPHFWDAHPRFHSNFSVKRKATFHRGAKVCGRLGGWCQTGWSIQPNDGHRNKPTRMFQPNMNRFFSGFRELLDWWFFQFSQIYECIPLVGLRLGVWRLVYLPTHLQENSAYHIDIHDIYIYI